MNAPDDGHDEARTGNDTSDEGAGPPGSRGDKPAGKPPGSAADAPGADAAEGGPEAPGAAVSERPAILQESRFTLEEGTVYRLLRTGAIWMNKLFFSSLFLLFLWLLLGATGQVPYGCADSFTVTEGANGTADEAGVKCSVWLSPTAKYLGAMTVFSFLLSIAFGMIGLVVGKDVVAMTPTKDEPGAEQAPDAEQRPGTENRGGDGPGERPGNEPGQGPGDGPGERPLQRAGGPPDEGDDGAP